MPLRLPLLQTMPQPPRQLPRRVRLLPQARSSVSCVMKHCSNPHSHVRASTLAGSCNQTHCLMRLTVRLPTCYGVHRRVPQCHKNVVMCAESHVKCAVQLPPPMLLPPPLPLHHVVGLVQPLQLPPARCHTIRRQALRWSGSCFSTWQGCSGLSTCKQKTCHEFVKPWLQAYLC